jgi:hypothetical protein
MFEVLISYSVSVLICCRVLGRRETDPREPNVAGIVEQTLDAIRENASDQRHNKSDGPRKHHLGARLAF